MNLSVGNSTDQLADEYVEELKEGMKYYLSKQHIKAKFPTAVLVQDHSGNAVGDVDLMVIMNKKHRLLSMLPEEKHVRPAGIQSIPRQAYIIELKMSCLYDTMEKKVRQFCSFYQRLLRPDDEPLPAGESPIDYDSAFTADQLSHLRNEATPVIFLFNHADNVYVENQMRKELGINSGNEIFIHGHPVVLAWVKNVVGWKYRQASADEIRKLKEEIRAAEEENRKLKKKLSEYEEEEKGTRKKRRFSEKQSV